MVFATDFPLKATSATATSATFTLGHGPALNQDYTICWRNDGASRYVPAGALTVVGAQGVAANCVVSTSQDCVVEIPVAGIGHLLPDAVATLTGGGCGKSAVAAGMIRPNPQKSLIHTIDVSSSPTKSVFNFGPISGVSGPLTICWSPVAASAVSQIELDVGTITFDRSVCASTSLFPSNVAKASLPALVTDTACRISVSEKVGASSLTLTEYAIKESSRLKTSPLLPLVLPRAGITDRNSILAFAAQFGTSESVVFDLISYGVVVTQDAVQAAVAAGRDDLCSLFAQRAQAGYVGLVLADIVSADLSNCLASAVTRRGVDVGDALHRAIDVENPEAFKVLLNRCCPLAQCLDVSNGAHTVKERIDTRIDQGSDQPDVFVLAVRDRIATCSYS
jgi:hypothetical protein